MRLMVEVGTGCTALADEQMRDLACQRIEVDEIWSYVGKKRMHLKPTDDRRRLGDQWTFVAIDPETKLIPAYRVGKRARDNAVAFMTDLSERLSNRVQISSDSLAPMWTRLNGLSARMWTTGRLLNFTMPSRSGRALCPSARDRRGAHGDRGKP